MAYMQTTEAIALLSQYSTYSLLSLLQACRRCGGQYSLWDNNVYITKPQVKAVLATRPHIPNKQERAAIRKATQKHKQNR